MMNKKISIITSFPISIPHPRVETERKILAEAGYDVKVLSFPRQPETRERLVNYLSFNFFKKHVYHNILESITNEDIIILYDYQLLPLITKIKNKKVRVIYETIDNMVHLNYHYLATSVQLIKPFGRCLLSRYSALEKSLAKGAAGIIVNSKALEAYFQPLNTTLIYYCSPFESEINTAKSNAGKTPALLYLGLFSKDKGAYETLELQKKLGWPLFISGDIKDEGLIKAIRNNPGVNWEPRQAPEQLIDKLKVLHEKYMFFGVSIIQAVHLSYATQEANKDQDYLALGVPIIGNTRVPTFEKIQAGCGILFTETEKIKKIADDFELYKTMSTKCFEFYKQHYSITLFRKKLLSLVDYVSGQTI